MKLDVPLPPEKQGFIVYRSRDYVERDAPAFAHDWDVLLDQARASLKSRRDSYPAWVESGRMSADDAAADIQAWEWIAAEWTWAVTGEGERPPLVSLDRRRAAIALQLERIKAQFDRGNRSADLARQAHVAMALAWHLDRAAPPAPGLLAEPPFHAAAALNHRLRREGRTNLEFL